MSHLGSRLSALVDGQLAPTAADRVLTHVASCPECAAELAAARDARRALACADDVVPTSDLTARLLLLAGDAQRTAHPRARDPFAAQPDRANPTGADALLGSGRGLPTHALTGDVLRRPARRRAVVSSAGVGVVVIALFVMGDSPTVVPSDQTSHALALLGQATPFVRGSGAPGSAALTGASVETASVPAAASSPTDYLAWLREHGWASPASLPDGWTVTAVRFAEDGALEVDLVGRGASIVVTERHAQLDTDALADVDQVELGERAVYVLSADPWHAAWQSGDTVVEVVAAGQSSAVTTLVAGFPADGYDGGVPARITRGWGTVTQAILQP